MLRKSFKAGKCKTSLRLALARMKVLKNKGLEAAGKLRRDLAQLLQEGNDQTARIRVEHVIREEKLIAAYDLIQLYCDLVIARLDIIGAQKNCPIDLKEAISSIIFAAPRCAADIPDLLDVQKHFKTKYGKEFYVAAVELRPDSGVNRMIVQYLSAKAPDIETKVKVLTAIASEHKINWEPKSFDEQLQKFHEDPLKGPNSFENSNKVPLYSFNSQNVFHSTPKHESIVKLSENEVAGLNLSSSSSSTRTIPQIDPQPEERSPAWRHQEFEATSSYSKENDIKSQPSWRIDYKDANSAAWAAAEAAERATAAAKAAAKFASASNNSRSSSIEIETSNYFNNEISKESLHKSMNSKSRSGSVVQDNFEMDCDRVEKTYRTQSQIQEKTKDGDTNEYPGSINESYGSLRGRGGSSSSVSSASVQSFDDDTSKTTFQEKHSHSLRSSSKQHVTNHDLQRGSVNGDSSELFMHDTSIKCSNKTFKSRSPNLRNQSVFEDHKENEIDDIKSTSRINSSFQTEGMSAARGDSIERKSERLSEDYVSIKSRSQRDVSSSSKWNTDNGISDFSVLESDDVDQTNSFDQFSPQYNLERDIRKNSFDTESFGYNLKQVKPQKFTDKNLKIKNIMQDKIVLGDNDDGIQVASRLDSEMIIEEKNTLLQGCAEKWPARKDDEYISISNNFLSFPSSQILGNNRRVNATYQDKVALSKNSSSGKYDRYNWDKKNLKNDSSDESENGSSIMFASANITTNTSDRGKIMPNTREADVYSPEIFFPSGDTVNRKGKGKNADSNELSKGDSLRSSQSRYSSSVSPFEESNYLGSFSKNNENHYSKTPECVDTRRLSDCSEAVFDDYRSDTDVFGDRKYGFTDLYFADQEIECSDISSHICPSTPQHQSSSDSIVGKSPSSKSQSLKETYRTSEKNRMDALSSKSEDVVLPPTYDDFDDINSEGFSPRRLTNLSKNSPSCTEGRECEPTLSSSSFAKEQEPEPEADAGLESYERSSILDFPDSVQLSAKGKASSFSSIMRGLTQKPSKDEQFSQQYLQTSSNDEVETMRVSDAEDIGHNSGDRYRLRLETISGGLRNKGLNLPHSVRSPLGKGLLSLKQTSKDASAKMLASSDVLDYKLSNHKPYSGSETSRPSPPISSYESDSSETEDLQLHTPRNRGHDNITFPSSKQSRNDTSTFTDEISMLSGMTNTSQRSGILMEASFSRKMDSVDSVVSSRTALLAYSGSRRSTKGHVSLKSDKELDEQPISQCRNSTRSFALSIAEAPVQEQQIKGHRFMALNRSQPCFDSSSHEDKTLLPCQPAESRFIEGAKHSRRTRNISKISKFDLQDKESVHQSSSLETQSAQTSCSTLDYSNISVSPGQNDNLAKRSSFKSSTQDAVDAGSGACEGIPPHQSLEKKFESKFRMPKFGEDSLQSSQDKDLEHSHLESSLHGSTHVGSSASTETSKSSQKSLDENQDLNSLASKTSFEEKLAHAPLAESLSHEGSLDSIRNGSINSVSPHSRDTPRSHTLLGSGSPKKPIDYNTFAAHFRSLRSNRR